MSLYELVILILYQYLSLLMLIWVFNTKLVICNIFFSKYMIKNNDALKFPYF